MRGFKRLQKLEFPLEIAICNMTNAIASWDVVSPNISLIFEGVLTNEHHELNDDALFINDLVPILIS